MIGFAMCGSFCTVGAALKAMEKLVCDGNDVVPVMSGALLKHDTRFGTAKALRAQVEDICKRRVIDSIVEAEPLGPKVKLEALIIAPCTGNTLAKIANGISDGAVTMAAKAHARSQRPTVIALASNDALGTGLSNIAKMMQKKNVFFVPMSQDSPDIKPNSLVCDYAKLGKTLEYAMAGRQYQPVLLAPGSTGI